MEQHTTTNHTETSLDGSVLIITDVPAHIFEENGERQVIYDMDVALKIDDFVATVFEGQAEPNRVITYSYNYLDASQYADAQIRMKGSDSNRVSFGTATTKVWKDGIDSIHRGISFLQSAYESIFEGVKIQDPVLIPAPGSLLFNLYAKEPQRAKQEPFFNTPQPLETRVLELLMDSYSYAVDDSITNELIDQYPQFKLASIKAIESLSPKKSSEIDEVEIVPKSKTLSHFKAVTLTKATREIARSKRSWLEGGSEPSDIRQVDIIGQVAGLSRDGSFTIKDIEYNHPEGKMYPTRALYYPHLFEELADLLKSRSRVRFRGIEYRRNNKWDSTPNIRTLEEAPSEEKIAEMSQA